jgi:hypothetical protein
MKASGSMGLAFTRVHDYIEPAKVTLTFLQIEVMSISGVRYLILYHVQLQRSHTVHNSLSHAVASRPMNIIDMPFFP